MTFEESYNLIKEYNPKNTQEEIDKELFLQCLDTFKEKLFDRNTLVAHTTASCIIFNESKTKVLFAYHNIYKSYSWLGGHNDNNFDYKEVAFKEAYEESSIKNLRLLKDEIASIEILPVETHFKKGKLIPHHLHLNVTYVFIGNENDRISKKEDENSDVKWIKIDKLADYVTESRMIPIYKKIISSALAK